MFRTVYLGLKQKLGKVPTCGGRATGYQVVKLHRKLTEKLIRRPRAAVGAAQPSSASQTRRQLFAGAAGVAIGGTALAADAALRPASALAQLSLVVDLTSNQTIGGIKTFTQSPVVPDSSFPQTAVANLVTTLAEKQNIIPGGTYVRTTGTTSVDGSFALAHVQGGTLAAPTSVAPFTFQPRDLAKGPFMFRVYGGQVNSTWDTIFAIGYNSDASRPNEPSAEFAIEQDYEAAPGVHKMEMYFQFGNAARTTFLRPFFSDYDRATGAIAVEISATSMIRFRDALTAADWGALSSSGFLFGSPGQSLQFLSHGRLTFNSGSGTSIFNVGNAVSNLFYRASVHSFQSIAGGQLLTLSSSGGAVSILAAPTNGHIVSVVRQGAGAQFFSVQEWQTSVGSVLSKIDRGGRFVTKVNTAPADAHLAPNECALWFDSTNGGAKVMFKAREAGGTIRTGELALA
jgi:hypothetical protein